MPNKTFLQKLGFLPKNNTSGIFYKNYQNVGNYCIEVDLEEKKFNFGIKIKSERMTFDRADFEKTISLALKKLQRLRVSGILCL